MKHTVDKQHREHCKHTYGCLTFVLTIHKQSILQSATSQHLIAAALNLSLKYANACMKALLTRKELTLSSANNVRIHILKEVKSASPHVSFPRQCVGDAEEEDACTHIDARSELIGAPREDRAA